MQLKGWLRAMGNADANALLERKFARFLCVTLENGINSKKLPSRADMNKGVLLISLLVKAWFSIWF